MNCDEAQHKLSDHLHEMLPPHEAAAMAQHLTECGACAQAYCRVQAQLRGIALAYAERPSPAARMALRAQVRAEFSPSLGRRALAFLSRPVPAYGAALAAAIPLMIWAFSDPPPARTEATSTSHVGPALIDHYDATEPLLDPSVS